MRLKLLYIHFPIVRKQEAMIIFVLSLKCNLETHTHIERKFLKNISTMKFPLNA